MDHREDKIVGCLLGGAIGDAMGGPYEGRRPPITISDGGEWRISDDTQLTLATCEAIIECGGRVDPETIAKRFAGWFREKRLSGIGASTYKALSELAAGGHWALVGRKGVTSAGSGAAMRVAPLAFLLEPNASDGKRVIRDVSRITHHNDEAYAGALAVVVAVRAAWTGEWTESSNLLNLVVDAVPETEVRDRLLEIAKVEDGLSLPEVALRFASSGYVVETVPMALCAANRTEALGFKRMIHELISAGGDTDTTASIAGQIAGTVLGFSAPEAETVSRLRDLAFIQGASDQFAWAATHN